MKILRFLFLLTINSLLIIKVKSAMHWAVTENGRIETQINSVFHLRRPFDLITLMEQEERLRTLDEIYHDLLARKSSFDRKWVGLDGNNGEVGLDKAGGLRGFNAADLEAKLYAKDPDCLAAGGKPLPLSHLYPGSAGIASLMREEMRLENNLKHVPESDNPNVLPDCESSYPLDLSMQAFEHLLGLKERLNLSMNPEPSLESAFLFHLHKNPIYMEQVDEWPEDEEEVERKRQRNSSNQKDPTLTSYPAPSTTTTSSTPTARKLWSRMNINHFGRRVGLALASNSTSWPLHNLASLFWRIVGNAPRAIECARRAVHLSPSKHRDVGLAQMGWVLLSSGRPAEAAIILHAAVDHAAFSLPSESQPLEHLPVHTAPPATHLALANAYALLSDYNRSLACYDNALKLQPSLRVAQLGRSSVLCQQKLEKSLINMVDSLRDMLVELQEYHKKQEEWLKLQEKLLWEQAPLEVRLMNYGQDKIITASAGQRKNCIHHQKEGHMILSCDLEASHTLETDITLSLQLLMKNVVSQAKKISSAMFNGIGKRREVMPLNLKDENPVKSDSNENQVYFSTLESKDDDAQPPEDDLMEFTLKPVDESTLADHVTWGDVEHLMYQSEGDESGAQSASIPVCPTPKKKAVEPYICTPISTNPKGAQAFKWQENGGYYF